MNLLMLVFFMQAEQHAQHNHNFARRIVALGREEGIKKLARLQATAPHETSDKFTPEQLYNRCERVSECDTLFTIIDGKVCTPSVLQGTEESPFITLPIPDDWHAEIAQDVAKIKAGMMKESEAVVSEVMQRASKIH